MERVVRKNLGFREWHKTSGCYQHHQVTTGFGTSDYRDRESKIGELKLVVLIEWVLPIRVQRARRVPDGVSWDTSCGVVTFAVLEFTVGRCERSYGAIWYCCLVWIMERCEPSPMYTEETIKHCTLAKRSQLMATSHSLIWGYIPTRIHGKDKRRSWWC